jgi:hypothetical protein
MMSDSTKFTPTDEQWTAEIGEARFNQNLHTWLVGSQYGPICELTCATDRMMQRARLIAAAPDLYEALSGLLEGVLFTQKAAHYPPDHPINKSIAALAKARGETSLAQAEAPNASE